MILPDDVIEFLRQVCAQTLSGDDYRVTAQCLLDKYQARDFRGIPNETWTVPLEPTRQQ